MEEDRINELLGRVERVDAPPFLFTRITARIEAQREARPARSWVLVTSLAMVMLLAMNSYVLFGGIGNEKAGIERLAVGMNVGASNQLYHD